MNFKAATFSFSFLCMLTQACPSIADETSARNSWIACEKKIGSSQCWKPIEQHFQTLTKPTNQRRFDEYLLQYFFLAKMAHMAGDLADAERLLQIVEQLEIERKALAPSNNPSLTPVIEYDRGLLYLSRHSYELALQAFDNAEKSTSSINQVREIKLEISIARASALIGLSQWSALEIELAKIISSLNFKENSPAIVWPIGPQLTGPYVKARRVAAAYVRLNQLDLALSILDQAERERRHAMSIKTAEVPKIIRLDKPWADLCRPIDLMMDKSEILIRQGKLQEAEVLLHEASQQEHEQDPANQKRLLLKRSNIAALKGDIKLKAHYLNEAVAIIDSNQEKFDPTINTFNFLN